MGKTSEQLRELVLELEYCKANETNLRQDSDFLVESIQALTSVNCSEDLLDRIFEIFKNYTEYSDAILLKSEGSRLKVVKSTSKDMGNLSLPNSTNFENCLSMKPIILNDIHSTDEFREFREIFKSYFSALYLPVIGTSKKFIFCFIHNSTAWFKRKDLNFALRLIPSICQAFEIFDSRDELIKEVEERKKVEKENSALVESLVERAFLEGVSDSTRKLLHSIGNIITPFKMKIYMLRNSDLIKSGSLLLSILDGYLNDKISLERLIELLKVFSDELRKLGDDAELKLLDFNKRIELIAEEITSHRKNIKPEKKVIKEEAVLEIIRGGVEANRKRLDRLNISANIHYTSEMSFLIEKMSFKKVILYLIDNAIDSIELMNYQKSEGRIDIQLYARDDGLGVISISDNGNGFSMDQKHELFSYGHTTKDGGSGRNLHYAANFIKSSDGKVDIFSEGLGRGAVLIIEIPLFLEEGGDYE